MPEGYGIRPALVTVPDVGDFLRQLRAIGREHNAAVVCFNADAMAGLRHAEAAVAHAIRSFDGGCPIAKTFEMEALLYAAGTRQCANAAALGVGEGENRVYVCCRPARPCLWEALSSLVRFTEDTWEAPDAPKRARLKRFYAITGEEIAAAGGESRLQDLVIERVALLDAYR